MALEQTAKLEEALRVAVDLLASDIHLVPGEPMVFRVQNRLQRHGGEPLTAEDVEAMAVAAVGKEALDAIGKGTGNAVTSCGIPDVVDGQLSVAKAMGQVTITIRVLPGIVLTAAQTGAPKALIDAVESPNGLVIVGGVTGSGKSTTAISLVDHLNATRPIHIITVEDPICARLTSKQGLVQQREVGVDVPDAISGMRAALKQDPDVFYLSELKTQAELEGIITLAEAGHLVIVVAHGATPEDIIQRFIDVFPEEGKQVWVRRFGEVLRAVSVQWLIRKATGRGRVAAYGVLTPDAETQAAMLSGDNIAKRAKPLPAGCQTMADHIKAMRDEGIITEAAADEALKSI